MNKYHKHQSRGISKQTGKARGKLRCPITGVLLDKNNSKTVVVADEKVNSYLIAMVVHMSA